LTFLVNFAKPKKDEEEEGEGEEIEEEEDEEEDEEEVPAGAVMKGKEAWRMGPLGSGLAGRDAGNPPLMDWYLRFSASFSRLTSKPGALKEAGRSNGGGAENAGTAGFSGMRPYLRG